MRLFCVSHYSVLFRFLLFHMLVKTKLKCSRKKNLFSWYYLSKHGLEIIARQAPLDYYEECMREFLQIVIVTNKLSINNLNATFMRL